MSKRKIDFSSILSKLNDRLVIVRKYAFVLFIAFVAVIYGFVIYKIDSLGSQQPSDASVSSQVKSAQVPHIDPAAVQQLQSLQDNSVNVKALFDQARSNPFQD